MKGTKTRRWPCAIIALLLLVTMLSACQTGGTPAATSTAQTTTTTKATTAATQAQSTTTAAATTATAAAGPEFSYPITPTVTITFPYTGDQKKDFISDEAFLWNNLERMTGVHIEWVGWMTNPMLNLATKNLPDIWYAVEFMGSLSIKPEVAIKEGYILNLNDLEDSMPNYFSYLRENPTTAAQVVTDEGQVYVVASENDAELPYDGFVFRKDWLDTLELKVPRTTDQVYEALKGFKEVIGAKTPLAMQTSYIYGKDLSSAFNTVGDFYLDDNQIKHGILDAGFHDYIAMLAQWYAEGLIDQDLPSAAKNSVVAAIANGSAGMVGNQLWKIDNMLLPNKDNPDFKLVGMQPLVSKEGETPTFGTYNSSTGLGMGASITGTCKIPEIAARFLDFGYTYDGIMWNSYGAEGYNYVIENGKPVEAGVFLNLPEGVTKMDVNYQVRKNGSYPAAIVKGSTSFGMSKETVEVSSEWAKHDGAQRVLPNLARTEVENGLFAKLYTDINTNIKESVIKFIMGIEPMSNWDAFIEGIKKAGIEDVINVQQQAYDRFLVRKEAGLDAIMK